MTDYGRETWEEPNYRITGPTPKWHEVSTPILHHSGASVIPADKASWLRSMQRDYTDNRGYSLGYGWLVDQLGDSYEIRGADYRNAANSGSSARNDNDWTFSYLVATLPHEPASDAAIATCNRLWASRVVPRLTLDPTAWIGHSDIAATACPGSGNQHRLKAGDFDHKPATPGGEMHYLNAPVRILDSRLLGDKPQGHRTITVPAAIPAVEAIMLTLTSVDAEAVGYGTVWAQGPRPEASALNYAPPHPLANTTVTALDTGTPTFQLYLHTPTHVIIDIVGYQ